MTPVYQTIFGDKNGNCYAACLASIFEIPLEEVPNFCSEEAWPKNKDEWLSERGFATIQFDITEANYSGWISYLSGPLKDLFHIAVVKSPRGDWLHAVVFQNGKLIHDPHPEGGSETATPVDIEFLIALDPAKLFHANIAATAISEMIAEAFVEERSPE